MVRTDSRMHTHNLNDLASVSRSPQAGSRKISEQTKHKEHGLGDGVLNWFKSYLYNGKQKEVIQSSKSSLSSLRAGVPPGSVLGHLVFSFT